MDKDRVQGSFDQAKGKLKEGVGNLTGDQKLKGEGKADQVAGKVKNTIGSAKDKIRETLKDLRVVLIEIRSPVEHAERADHAARGR